MIKVLYVEDNDDNDAIRDGAMASRRDCIEFAKQCTRLASLCEDDPQLREHLLELAREWIAMAAHDHHPATSAADAG